jgi:endonuclease G
MRIIGLAALLIAAPIELACAADLSKCVDNVPYGMPHTKAADHQTLICHAGYAAMHDDDKLIPRWVAYHLTGEHTLGCGDRGNRFHADATLPADRRATPSDYAKSGYDKGHQAPAADFAWDEGREDDSFSMANMAPQKPGLNRQGWERLEETGRSWAWKRGDLIIYVGPVLDEKPKAIGKHKVAVPSSFWKVIVDTQAPAALAFLMPNKTVPKGALAPWQRTVADVERQADVELPMPEAIDRNVKPKLWPADLAGWRRKHSEVCSDN